jgi:hypothetical protein
MHDLCLAQADGVPVCGREARANQACSISNLKPRAITVDNAKPRGDLASIRRTARCSSVSLAVGCGSTSRDKSSVLMCDPRVGKLRYSRSVSRAPEALRNSSGKSPHSPSPEVGGLLSPSPPPLHPGQALALRLLLPVQFDRLSESASGADCRPVGLPKTFCTPWPACLEQRPRKFLSPLRLQKGQAHLLEKWYKRSVSLKRCFLYFFRAFGVYCLRYEFAMALAPFISPRPSDLHRVEAGFRALRGSDPSSKSSRSGSWNLPAPGSSTRIG